MARKPRPKIETYYIRCPCKRGYMHQLCVTSEGVPMAFGIGGGYLLIQGNCDTCKAIIQFAVPLADLTFNEPHEWQTQIDIIGRRT